MTRDEAIAIVAKAAEERRPLKGFTYGQIDGIRLALEALAAAGVFVDGPIRCDYEDNCHGHAAPDDRPCGHPDDPTMANLLDAAGIR